MPGQYQGISGRRPVFMAAAATTVWEKHWAWFCGFPLFRAPHHFNHKITANLQKGKEILANLRFLFFF